jgi:hypothetical protein
MKRYPTTSSEDNKKYLKYETIKIMNIQNPDTSSIKTEFSDNSTRNVSELETVYIGKGTYLPGWRWSKHAKSITGKQSERHIGYIISGSFGIKDPEGNEKIVKAGEAFEIGPDHDAWVIGDEPCIALDFESKK